MSQDNSIGRILLVDDNPDDRLLAIRELRREFPKIQIEEVSSPDGLERALANKLFDLVITDYQINWTTGLDVLLRIKAFDRNCPVIMFTNTGNQEIAVEAMKAGLNDYVTKSAPNFLRLTQSVKLVWQQSQTGRQAVKLELRLQSLLNQLQVGVFRATLAGQLLEVNTAFLKLLAVTSLQEAQLLFGEQIYTLIDEVGQSEREVQIRRADNSNVWVLINETLNKLNGETAIDGLVYDTTDRKQKQVEIQQLNETLERKVQERTAQLENVNRELQAFAYSVSHDLRSPIRQINGFANLLQEHLQTIIADETSQRFLQAIVELTNRAGKMVDDVLIYSRTGRVQMHYCDVNMQRLVLEVRQAIEMETAQREIVWQIEPLAQVWGDRSLLRLVWENLIENAVKFTQTRSLAEITINSIDGEQETIFCVRDNGVGFDMQYADKLFNIFGRLHSEREFAGTGIGLANVGRIIYRHNGKVWAEGTVDVGASFYFSLPKTTQS